jgi:hypothetical protein
MPPVKSPQSFLNKIDSDVKKELLPADPIRTLGIIFVCIAVIVSIVSYGAMSYFYNTNNHMDSQIKSILKDLNSKPVPEMYTFYNRIKTVNLVLNNHVYVNSIFTFLSEVVEADVYFKKFELNSKEKGDFELVLLGVASDERSIVRQLDKFKDPLYKDLVKSVELNGVSEDKLGNLTFDVKLTVSPFKKDVATVNETDLNSNTNREVLNVSSPSVITNPN